MERHEIPTHLNVPDHAYLGLTMRQLLTVAIGLALAYSAVSDVPLPFTLRLAGAAGVLLVTAVLALWRPAGRAAEEWAFVLVRYWATPRVAVWRPRAWPAPGTARRFEVILPGRGRRADGGGAA